MRWSRVDLWSTRVASGSGMGPPLLKVSYTVRTGPQKRKICEPSLLCRALPGHHWVDLPGIIPPGAHDLQEHALVIIGNAGRIGCQIGAGHIAPGSLERQAAGERHPQQIFLVLTRCVAMSTPRRRPGMRRASVASRDPAKNCVAAAAMASSEPAPIAEFRISAGHGAAAEATAHKIGRAS